MSDDENKNSDDDEIEGLPPSQLGIIVVNEGYSPNIQLPDEHLSDLLGEDKEK